MVGLTGGGGSALMTPILLIFFSVSPTTDIAIDLWFAAITKLVGARVHTALTMSTGRWLNACGWGASRKDRLVDEGYRCSSANCRYRVACFPEIVGYARGRLIGMPERFKAMQPVLTSISGGVLGMRVALTSVGAGALGSMMLLYLYPLRMTPHRLVAKDIVHAIPLAVVAGLGYLLAGMVDGWMLVSLLIGSIPTVLLGSMLAGKISGRWIQITLAIVLLAAGIKVLS